MGEGEVLESVSAELAIKDDREFLDRAAPALAARGLFVELFDPPPIGSRVMAELRLARGMLKVLAVIERYAERGEARGILLKFPSLDSQSVQFVELPVDALAAPEFPPEPRTVVGLAPELATEARTVVNTPSKELLRAICGADAEDGGPES